EARRQHSVLRGLRAGGEEVLPDGWPLLVPGAGRHRSLDQRGCAFTGGESAGRREPASSARKRRCDLGGAAGGEEGRRRDEDAAADAQIPQTTAIKRNQTITVVYDGEPKFKEIEGTKLAYAVNTSFSVIRDTDKYWACHQAAWYVSDAPKGPWKVSDKRPPSI